MSQTKTLAELTIKNNFLFSAVMLDPENCRGLLEIILGISIDRVIVIRNTAASVWISTPETAGIPIITWRCRSLPSPLLQNAAAIITARWTWSCFWPEQIIQGFRIPMSFLSVILIPSANKDIYTPLKTAVWKTDKSCWTRAARLYFSARGGPTGAKFQRN